MSAIFITATGTDIGKTFVAAGLIRHWRAAGRTVEALKPVVTGFDPAAAAASDPGVLLTALGRPVTPAEIDSLAPWRFTAPLSPDMAARRSINITTSWPGGASFRSLFGGPRVRTAFTPMASLILSKGDIPIDRKSSGNSGTALPSVASSIEPRLFRAR